MEAATSSLAASSSSLPPPFESRTEAGPLPTKRGEIGYRLQEEVSPDLEQGPNVDVSIPARHPADRDVPPTPHPTSPLNSPSNPINPPVSTPVPASPTPNINAASAKPRQKFFGFWKVKSLPTYGGLHLTTLIAFVSQFCLVGGTITAWALAVIIMSKKSPVDTSSDNSGSDPPPDTQINSSSTSIVFIHVLFGIAVLAQLLFLERRLFRLRAQRYSFVHPGEILPSARTRGFVSDVIAFSPWNRPPLPTYAAALAQSGAGTGDVEDHIIAQPPPPAYGVTRGSTFLLSGFLRASLQAQRPVSVHTQVSISPDERPKSYTSLDGDWEEIQNAERARRLEETLAQLQSRPTSRLSQGSR